ncbi:MAG TPA: carbohydrate ABC transporter permease [Clostridia bacterium]
MQKFNQTKGEKAFNIFNAIFLIALSVVCIYPLYYVLIGSISDPVMMMKHQGLLLVPYGFDLEAYQRVFANPMIPIGYRNTIVYLVCGTIVNLVLTTLGAYTLSRKNVMFRDFVMFMIVFTMLFQGGMIPTYLLVNDLGLVNSWLAMILPSAINTINLIIMRTSVAAIPESLLESARIEGAGEFSILIRIVIPLSKAVIAVMILYYGVYHWNTWFNAMLYLRTRTLYPLQLVLRDILIATGGTAGMTTGTVNADEKEYISMTIKYATIIVATLPILFVYPFVQKYFVKGVMIGAIKE